jgi:dienelactone hydrolase
VNPLARYQVTDFENHHVYRRGAGPAVLVLHELPGMHPRVVAFADRLVDRDYSVYLPSFFGRDGAELGQGFPLALQMGRALFQICVSREFALLRDRTSPAVHWLRRLANRAHAECGGPGVGVVGMCITGGFALAMALDDVVVAPVMSQPSLPYALPFRKRTLGIDEAELAGVQKRAANGLEVLGLRFSGDRLCPRARFDRLRDELGTGFMSVEIDSSQCNAAEIRERAHAVLTVDFVDREGHPTREALDRVLVFLRQRLQGLV